MKLETIFPFLVWMRLLTLKDIKSDFLAGLTGAVIVLPQGIAFAAIAGLPPQYGLYTAMVTPIIAALFGSSRHLVSGPTTAISIVIFASASHHAEVGSPEFISMALTLTFLAGVYQFVFGLARMGVLVNFVSHTVVIGFTAGAAILIATSQIKHLTAVEIPKGESFLHTWYDLYIGIPDINYYVLFVGIMTLIVAIISRKLFKRIPYLLVGMIVGSIVALLLRGQTDSIKLVGEIPAMLPPLSMPEFSFETIKLLAPEAMAIALLGLIEAVSISRAVATKSGQKIDSNQEFIGQGLSNLVGSFFSSYAGSGSFTRTGVNYEAGAKSPLSAVFAALLLMAIVLLIAPLTAYLPIAAMGGIILLVAYNLVDFHHIKQTLKFNKSESSILITTILATLFLELEFAIYLGVMLSLVLFLARTSKPKMPVLSIDVDKDDQSRKLVNIRKKPLKQCPQFKIIRVDMSVYFGSINSIQDQINDIVEHQHVYHVLIVASGINFIDLAGVEGLVSANEKLSKHGGGLYFVGLKSRVYVELQESFFIKRIGNDHFYDTVTKAIQEIYKKLDRTICSNCEVEIFKECR